MPEKPFLFFPNFQSEDITQYSKSNQIKSLLLSHHHSTSALVSEILMSVLQTVQKNNRQFTYGQTVQKKQQTIYIWTDSAKKTTDNLHMDRQCKKLHWSIYSAPDSAKKTTTAIYIWTDSAKTTDNLHMDRQCKKQQTIYIWTTVQKTALEHLQCSRQCKKTTNNLHMDRQCKKSNSNLHMDSTYLQTVQKTMCKIHIHILSTHSVL